LSETLQPALPDELDALAERLMHRLCRSGLMVATAESCTGGLLASLLTDVEGVSSAFDRGFVTYSSEAKCELLHIAPETVESCGAVSRTVAIAMAEGALAASRADIVLAITGFAGPGAPDDEPGLVHFACARRGGATAHREEHFGDIGRGPTRVACLETAVAMIEKAL
jgi:nicotinamide-nucleotide amidase